MPDNKITQKSLKELLFSLPIEPLYTEIHTLGFDHKQMMNLWGIKNLIWEFILAIDDPLSLCSWTQNNKLHLRPKKGSARPIIDSEKFVIDIGQNIINYWYEFEPTIFKNRIEEHLSNLKNNLNHLEIIESLIEKTNNGKSARKKYNTPSIPKRRQFKKDLNSRIKNINEFLKTVSIEKTPLWTKQKNTIEKITIKNLYDCFKSSCENFSNHNIYYCIAKITLLFGHSDRSNDVRENNPIITKHLSHEIERVRKIYERHWGKKKNI